MKLFISANITNILNGVRSENQLKFQPLMASSHCTGTGMGQVQGTGTIGDNVSGLVSGPGAL